MSVPFETLDRRTRGADDVAFVDAAQWVRDALPGLLEQRGEAAAEVIARLGVRPIHVVVGDVEFGLGCIDGRLITGRFADAATVVVEPEVFSDWVNWIVNVQRLQVTGDIRFEPRDRWVIATWELVLRHLTDGRAVHTPGSVSFVDRRGEPLDLHRCFTPDDDPADIAHFLREAGYLHLRGWVDPQAMDVISADMDCALDHYRPGDERSWWATLANGDEVCVRMRYFVEHSPATAAMLRSPRWEAVRRVIAGDDTLVLAPIAGNIIEALVKPLDVVRGISDVPWHRDCAFGGHPYQCAGVTVGVSVTAGTADTGLLRVVAGSHRAATLDDPAWRGNDLPIVPLPTIKGDLTVHLGCTIHEALPPRTAPRRVMYTGFGLPDRVDVTHLGAMAHRDVRNQAQHLVSQPDNATRHMG